MSTRAHPSAQPHGELREVLPDVFFVTGSMSIPGPISMRFSRNMTVIREGERLVIVNSVRLNDSGLRALDQLGKVTDVLRLAAFHGTDDPFYAERYGARTWTVRGQSYLRGFDRTGEPYHRADVEMHAESELPLQGAKLHVIASNPPEGLLLLEREGGILVSGDCLQNWGERDPYLSMLARPLMRWMGMLKPHNVGPAWLKRTKPPIPALHGLLEHSFEHVLPAHGEVVHGGAREKYRQRIERLRERP